MLFIITFLVGAPLLIIYTAGYRYNIKKGQVQRTGALVLETEPSRASVKLNNEYLPSSTPIRLNNILPDEYLITIEKEGFYSWEKTLDIRSQQTTFAEDVILFAKKAPEVIMESEISMIEFSPRNRYAVFVTNDFEQDYLYMLNLDNGKLTLIYNDNRVFVDPRIVWSSDESRFLFKTAKNLIVVPTKFPKNSDDLSLHIFRSYKNLKFYNDKLYGLDNNRISVLLDNDQYELVYRSAQGNVTTDFLFQGDDLYTVARNSNHNIISKLTMKDDRYELNKTIELNEGNYKIIGIYYGKIALTNIDNDNFYLIDSELNKVAFQKNSVENIDIHYQKNLMLLQSNQEVSYINLLDSEPKENTVTRYSAGLSNAFWHESSNYIFALQDEKVHVIELDNRDSKFVITLELDDVEEFAVDNSSEVLYYLQDSVLSSVEMVD